MKRPTASNPRYTPFHPKWYRRRMPIFWWLRRAVFVKFIARELTSLAVAYMAIALLVALFALAGGEEAWGRFLAWSRSVPVLVLNGMAVAALFFHTVSWLHLAPKALVVRLGGRRVPDGLIVAAHYGAWLAASALVLFVMLGG